MKRKGVLIKFRALYYNTCGGQNKNKYLLWFFVSLVFLAKEKRVELNCLIRRHTKNVWDGRFWLVKLKVRLTDSVVPYDMIHVIRECSKIFFQTPYELEFRPVSLDGA